MSAGGDRTAWRHLGLELRNVDANYPFESSRGFPGSEPNSGQGDHSRLSCSAGDTQLGAGFCRDLQQRPARTLAIMRRRREGTSAARGTAALRAALRPLLIGSRRARVARRSACGSPPPDPLQSGGTLWVCPLIVPGGPPTDWQNTDVRFKMLIKRRVGSNPRAWTILDARSRSPNVRSSSQLTVRPRSRGSLPYAASVGGSGVMQDLAPAAL